MKQERRKKKGGGRREALRARTLPLPTHHSPLSRTWGYAVPRLWVPPVQVIDRVEVHVFHVEGEHATPHARVQHGGRDARQVGLEQLQDSVLRNVQWQRMLSLVLCSSAGERAQSTAVFVVVFFGDKKICSKQQARLAHADPNTKIG